MSLVHHLVTVLALATQPSTAPPPGFQIERIADGVYVAVRREVPGFYFQSNAVFIVGDSDVVVVDAQFTRAATREVLAALRRITPLPVRYGINTHPHDDHITGNQVYRDAFPRVDFVGHANMREDMSTVGVKSSPAPPRSWPRTSPTRLVSRSSRRHSPSTTA